MGLTKAQLEALNDSSFPNNNAGAITPAILRDYNTEAILNTVNQDTYTTDSASFDSRIDSLVASTASYVTSAITASSLVTASFDTNTRNLTFTKGNSTAFSVNIPDVSGSTIDTSSLATTGSNSFLGTQTLLETGSWGGVLLNVQSGSIKFNGQVADTGFSATGSIFLSPVNLPHGSTKVVFQTEYQSGSTNPGGNDYILGIGRQGDTTIKTVDLGTDTTLDVSRATLVGFPFTTTASFNLFSGSQYKADSSSFNSRIAGISVDTSSLVSTSSFNAYTQSTNNTIAGLTTTASFNSYTASNDTTIAGLINTISITGSQGSPVNPSVINTLAITDLDGTIRYLTLTDQNVLNTTFATTGSNFFKGAQWFSDTADTASYTSLSEFSGSLILTAKGYNSASFSNITSSLAAAAGIGFVNLILKDTNATAQTILSGSNNIIGNPIAPTAGFTRFASNGNIALYGALPQISSSMTFPINMNGNFLQTNTNNIIARGPISSSAWTIAANFIPGTINIGTSAGSHAERIVNGLTLSTNNVPGTFNVIANQTALTGSLTTTITGNYVAGTSQLTLSSSAITYTNNIINGASVVDNGYYSASVGVGRITVSGNNFGGGTQNLIVSGGHVAGVAVPTFSNNVMFGNNNTLYSNVSNAAVSNSLYQHSAQNTMILGTGLIVSASSANAQADTLGSTFVGRYNAIDGNRAKTAQTVFAVGTGTSTTNQKTGLLIDSGSNTFVEGTLNISGSTSITGSLAIKSNNGFQLLLPSGSNQQTGLFVLNGGSPGVATISNTLVTANSLIFLTKQSNANSGNGTVSVTSKGSGTFSVTSDHNGDADTVAYMIINPSA